jgi:CBS domain-containing protein
VFDLLRAFRSSSSRWLPDLRALWGERVEDIMSRGLWTLQADEPIAAVVDMMLNHNVSVVPVVEGRRAAAPGSSGWSAIAPCWARSSSMISSLMTATRTMSGKLDMTDEREARMYHRVIEPARIPGPREPVAPAEIDVSGPEGHHHLRL